ncbi:MAG: NADH-quinone oxidoreductase subunit J [Bacteroidota bacterium]
MNFEIILFSVLSAVMVGSAIMVITRKSPVMSVLYLVLNFFALAGIYLTLHAQFIAVIQIIVYAGAIMVLFLFVIMLLNLSDEGALLEKVSIRKMAAVGLGFGVLLEFIYILGFSGEMYPDKNVERAIEIGTVEGIGKELFSTFLFPFEITSVILIAAIVGAVILAKRKLD